MPWHDAPAFCFPPGRCVPRVRKKASSSCTTKEGKSASGRKIRFNGLDEFIQPAKSFEFVAAIHFCRVQRSPQHIDRLIVGFQRDRKRVSILPPKREWSTARDPRTAPACRG